MQGLGDHGKNFEQTESRRVKKLNLYFKISFNLLHMKRVLKGSTVGRKMFGLLLWRFS